MACHKCEVRANLEGRSVHVRLLWENLEEIGKNVNCISILYRCRSCGALWESYGYEPKAKEISKEEAAKKYSIRDGSIVRPGKVV